MWVQTLDNVRLKDRVEGLASCQPIWGTLAHPGLKCSTSLYSIKMIRARNNVCGHLEKTDHSPLDTLSSKLSSLS